MDLRLALVLGVVLTSLLLISNDAKGLHVFPLICFFFDLHQVMGEEIIV
jgi:hypothetical protein